MYQKNFSKVFCGVVFAIAGACVACGAASSYIDACAASSWNSSEGVVVKSEAQINMMSRGYRVTPFIVYQYHVANREYTCDRIGFPNPANKTPNAAHEILNRYAVNTVVTVYYDPKNPGNASLHNNADFGELRFPIVISAILLTVSIYCLSTSAPQKWR
ncbi:MAG: DUF3592 domain-containing protein [Cyanobacteria bacterium SZAS-4]|nr:DUF3592 domain-containing protein [Cyanobacteria bacterium SZAS-4]